MSSSSSDLVRQRQRAVEVYLPEEVQGEGEVGSSVASTAAVLDLDWFKFGSSSQQDKKGLCSNQCKLCGRDGTIVMIPGQGTPLTIEQSQKGEKTCLMVFDCRGYEPVEFSFGAGWKAESVHGTPFDIDCSEGEFSEYDEKGECPVELSNLQSAFKVVKKHERGGKTRFV